jgi:hypothetical protein
MDLHSNTVRQYPGRTEENNENLQDYGPLSRESSQKFLETKAGERWGEYTTG